MIYLLTIWQISYRVQQFYEQTDSTTAAYETSYLAETPVNLYEMKQKIILGFETKEGWVKEPDPRAVNINPIYTNLSDLTTHTLEFEWCNHSMTSHLNIV